MRAEAARIMWQGCGLERDAAGLGEAMDGLEALPSPADPECAGLLEIARLTVRAALAREESRGAHFRSDFPHADPACAHRTCWAGDEPHQIDPAPAIPAAHPSDLTEAA